MNPVSAQMVLDEADPTGRLNDIQQRLFKELVANYSVEQAKAAIDRVYLERSSFDLPTFTNALGAVRTAAHGAGAKPWHFDTCHKCAGTGWEYIKPLDLHGITYDQVIRCTAGPRITANEWSRWKAEQHNQEHQP